MFAVKENDGWDVFSGVYTRSSVSYTHLDVYKRQILKYDITIRFT